MIEDLNMTLEYKVDSINFQSRRTIVQGYNSGVASDGSGSSVRLYAEGDQLKASFKETDKLVLTKAGEDLDFYRDGMTESSSGSGSYYGWLAEISSGSITESIKVWTLDQYPNSQSEIIELDGNVEQVLTDYTFKSFTNGTRYTKTLSAPLVQNKKYTSNILVDSSNITVSTQIEDSTPRTDSFPISNNLEGVDSFYFGVNRALSGTLPNTAFPGTIYLSTLSGSYNGANFDTVREEIRTTGTKDFIYIPDLPYNSYAFKNLDNMANFNVLDKAFSGNEESDGIDFNNPNGFSLCVKVNMEDLHDKLFFVKRLGTGVYCSLVLESSELIFTLNTQNSQNPIILSHVIQSDNHVSFTRDSILITITASVQENYVNFSMYKNNELLNSSLVPNPQFLNNASNYKIYNYLDTPTGNEKLYVSNIVSFTGVLSEDQLYYLTNIIDTNF